MKIYKGDGEQMKDIIKQYGDNFFRLLSLIFAVLGAIAIFFPINDIHVGKRIFILVSIVALVVIVAGILTGYMIIKNQRIVYSKGVTKIIFEYSDIKEIISDACSKEDEITIVIPVNTDLHSIFDREKIYRNTIHRICLDYIYNQTRYELNYDKLEDIKTKKDGFDCNGKLGDWFLLSDINSDEKGKINFLFVEFFNLEEKDGQMIISELEKGQYMNILQTIILAISKNERESKFYIPLIGAGAGHVDNPKEIMHFMNAILRFNKSELRQEIHIVINKKDRKEAPIYQLTEI